MSIKMTDSRRLTGPNLAMQKPGAIIDVECSNEHRQIIVNLWQDTLQNLLKHIEWQDETIHYRLFTNGINLVFSAQYDSLYAATEINELAFNIACRKFKGEKGITGADQLEEIKTHLRDEKNRHMTDVIKLADEKDVSFLTDDETFSLGYGKHSEQWFVNQIPNTNELDWQHFKDIPVFLVTGSNGKSTTVRLLSSILDQAGFKTGMTSTDFIRVGDKIIDHGDYSGPGGARTILRHHIADAAVLEIARGGILRRGLPCDKAVAAAVTNIAEDHLGDYGITNIEEMAETKLVVSKGLKKNGVLVLNADDEVLMNAAKQLPIQQTICYFSLENKDLDRLIYLENDSIFCRYQNQDELICNISEIPIALNGAARHNIANSMAAIALAKANHIETVHIKKGLNQFKGDLEDNPGRGNYFQIKGATVLVDFAHNAHGMQAIVDTVKQLRAKRRLLLIGQAGDRSDSDIKELARQAAGTNPDYIVITEIPVFLRGRREGEVPDLFAAEFKKLGFKQDQIVKTEDSLTGVQTAMNWSQTGDILILFALSQRNEIFHYLRDIQN